MLRRLEPDVIPEPTTSMYSDATTSTNADAYAATSPQDSEMIGTPNVKDMMRLFSSPGGRPKKKGKSSKSSSHHRSVQDMLRLPWLFLYVFHAALSESHTDSAELP